jgi:hypothetical protein
VQVTTLSNSAPQLPTLVLETTSHTVIFAFSDFYAHPALTEERAAALLPCSPLFPIVGLGFGLLFSPSCS